MDKYEYKIRTEEIKALIAKGKYQEAAEIADGIDWRRVKSVMMLCTISDLYKMNGRFEDSRDLLLLAYDRHPGGRSIVYSLCELSIKMGEFLQAVEYYKEFVQVAPKDNGRYVLQYKLYEAQDVSLEERIEVLEELKSREYVEKWAYELAYLYHRVGLGTKCVEECDDLILWFGEGKYVMKAMELKMLHEPLTPSQQEKYDFAKGMKLRAMMEEDKNFDFGGESDKMMDAPTLEIPSKELDIHVKVMGVGQYDTINMQKELAEHMKELWEGAEELDENGEVSQNTRVAFAREVSNLQEMKEISVPQPGVYPEEAIVEEPVSVEEPVTEEEPVGVQEFAPSEEPVPVSAMEELFAPEEPKKEHETEVFFGETGDMDTTASQVMEAMRNEASGVVTEAEEDMPGQITFGMDFGSGDMKEIRTIGEAADLPGNTVEKEQPKEMQRYEKMLGMEYDGQISMLLPESEQIEKQITGQICLEDVLLEWERMKLESEQKRREAVEQRVLQQTGAMFTEFEAAIRDGLLEKLEREKNTDDIVAEDYAAEDSDDLTGEFAEASPEEDFLAGADDEVEELEEIHESEEDSFVQEVEEEETVPEPETVEEEFEEDYEEAVYEEAGVEEEETSAEDIVDVDEEAFVGDFEEAETSPEVDIEKLIEESLETEEDTEEEYEEEHKEVFGEGMEEDTEEVTEEGAEEEETVTTDAEAAEEVVEETAETSKQEDGLRALSPEEQELFGAYTHSQKSKEQIINAIDKISMASYTGNVIITGDENMDTLTLAKNLVKEVQSTDNNFSGKVAKISGASLNQKDVEETLDKMANGALIIHKVAGLEKENAAKLYRVLEQEERGIIVIMIDTKKAVTRFLNVNSDLQKCFNIRVDVEALSDEALVKYGQKYAREQEYSIDEMGVLALHTAISDRQLSDHFVTIEEVREIVDEAIRRANRKTIGHFFDILVAKRYDDEDMIVLREKDFA